MNDSPIYIIREQFTDSWNDNHLCERMLTDTGYFVSLEDVLAKAWEFVSKAYKKYVDQYEEKYRDIGYTTPPKFEEIDNGFRATSWDLETVYQCTVECIYQNSEEGD
jgi:hypothetical protein